MAGRAARSFAALLLLGLAAPAPHTEESFPSLWQRLTRGALERSDLDLELLLATIGALVESGTAQVETLEMVSSRDPFAVLGIELRVEEIGLQARLETHGLRQSPAARSLELVAEVPPERSPSSRRVRLELAIQESPSGDFRAKATLFSEPTAEDLQWREEQEVLPPDGVQFEVLVPVGEGPQEPATAQVLPVTCISVQGKLETTPIAFRDLGVDPLRAHQWMATLWTRTRQRFERMLAGLRYD